MDSSGSGDSDSQAVSALEPPPGPMHSNAEFDLRQVPLDLGLVQLQLNILIAQVTEAPGKRVVWQGPREGHCSGRLEVLVKEHLLARPEENKTLPPPGDVFVLSVTSFSQG